MTRVGLPGLNKTRARALGLVGAHAEFGFTEWREVLPGWAGPVEGYNPERLI